MQVGSKIAYTGNISDPSREVPQTERPLQKKIRCLPKSVPDTQVVSTPVLVVGSGFVYHLAHRVVKLRTLAMIFTIAAIQRLKLCFCVDAINACSAQLLLRATRVLQQIVRPKPHDYALANDLKSPCGVRTQNMLCTWRPTFCMDIFLYFGRDQRITVGLPMELDSPGQQTLGRTWRRCCWENTTGPQQNAAKDPAQRNRLDITMGNENLSKALRYQTIFTECEWAAFGITTLGADDYIRCGDVCFEPISCTTPELEIKYFTPETTGSADGIPECVCFAHLTCDTDADNNNTMVALVYDILLGDTNDLESFSNTQQRYEYLRSISELLSGVTIGEACVRVQWAGDPCMYDRLQSLVLPHAHDQIVLYGDHHQYCQFPFDLQAPLSANQPDSV